MLNAWDIQPRESPQAFHAFVHYRDLGRARSEETAWIQHCSQCIGRHGPSTTPAPGGWKQWGVRWTWRERAAAWDRHLDQLVQKRREKEHEQMARRHAKLGKDLQDKGMARLSKLTPKQILRLHPSTALKLAESGVKIERTAEGQPTEAIQVTQEGVVQVQHTGASGEGQGGYTIDLKALSLEDLRTLEKILQKAAASAAPLADAEKSG